MTDTTRVTRNVRITDPEAVFSMQQRQAEALANMVGTESHRIDGLIQDVGAVRGTVEVVHAKVNDVATGVSRLTDAMAILVKHEVTMEHNATEVRTMREAQGRQDERLQVIERKAPGWDEMRVWVIRAGLGVLTMVGAALVWLVLKQPGAT